MRDRERVLRRVGARGLELEHELVGLDAALVVRLLVERDGERAHDSAGEFVAPVFDEEAVDVVGAVLLVFGEDLDEVLERLGLELVELLALRCADTCPRPSVT